jgi:hypothetical protein
MVVKSLIRPLIAAGFFCASLLTMAQQTALDCRLSTRVAAAPDQAVWLEFELTNRGSAPIWVLSWNTPIEGLRNRYLAVNGPAGEVPYRGPMFKRGRPTAEQYRRIEPGQSLRAEVDLRSAFDLSAPGQYELRYTGRILDVVANLADIDQAERIQQGLDIHCAPVRVDIKRSVK